MTTFRSPSHPFPAPCWSQDEIASLIDAYRDKWYSLRRTNLRASDWQEVADDVAKRHRLPSKIPQKTSTQCRHKMEKLRKRYRSEIQRAAATPKGYPPSWIHFNQMDLMEKGSTSMHQDEESEEGDRLLLYPIGIKQANPNKRFHNLIDLRNEFQINPVTEMVAGIRKLGDGFLRIEKMKMEMVKEVELMRLEMEMKRTEMIIESYQRFADSICNKKKKN